MSPAFSLGKKWGKETVQGVFLRHVLFSLSCVIVRKLLSIVQLRVRPHSTPWEKVSRPGDVVSHNPKW